MLNSYFEEIHKADFDYPYIQLQNINFSYAAHYHEEIEIIYIYSGTTVINVNGNDLELNGKDIFIVMPGEIHSISGTNNVIYIMKVFTTSDFLFLKINGHLTPDNEHYMIFKNIIEEIALEDTMRVPGYKYAVNAQTSKFMLEIIRTLKPVHIPSHIQKETARKMEFLNKVNYYLEHNYKDKITIDAFASYMGYSKYYFAHLFKEITHQSCMEFTTYFRLEKSKILLSKGNTITEAAYSCGFNNMRSFNRAFKTFYGITPSFFKNQFFDD